MRSARPTLLLTSTLALAACATEPTPVVGLPGPNKDYATFQKEDTACRQEAKEANRPASGQQAASPNTNDQWRLFFSTYAQCETSHGNVVRPVPWAVAYADYLGYNNGAAVPYVGTPYAYGYGYPYAYAGYPFYADPFLFGYPYPFIFGVGYGFGYGHLGYGHFGYGHFGGFHGGHR
jgi:hypothetical protein